jgi:hypothetical protein
VERSALLWNKRLAGGGTLSLPLFSPGGTRISLPLPDRRNHDAIWILDTSTGEGRVAVCFQMPRRIFFRASWVDNGAALVVNGYQTQTHLQLFDRFWTRDTIDRK